MTPSPEPTSVFNHPGQPDTSWFIVTVVVLVGIAYMLPTIIAIVRRLPDAGLVMMLNIFAGWSLIGWGFALYFATLPRARPAPARIRTILVPTPAVSPDGMYEWDGQRWVERFPEPVVSPDGNYFWDGAAWRPLR